MHILAIIVLAALPLVGAEAEAFLRDAEVTKVEDLDMGDTKPQRLTMSKDGVTARAIWKTVDNIGGTLHDYWGFEVAAYRLSKTLGLGIVPPTVRRTIDGVEGSLQLWMDDCEMLSDHGIHGVDMVQLKRVRMLGVIMNNLDAHNGNILVCEGGKKVYAIDASRAFQDRTRLYILLMHN